MAQYTLDLSGYRERLSATVPEGRYLAQIDDVEQTKTSSTNKDMFNVWVRIIDGPHAGSVIIDRLTITDKALFRIVGFLNGLGLPTPKKRLTLNTAQWMGRKVWIDTRIGEPYRGRPGKSEIEGYARYVAETADQDAVVPEVEPEPVLGDEVVAEDVMAFETTPAEVVDASQGDESATPAEDDAPATASPSVADRVRTAAAPAPQAEPEMLSLSDISL
jgi:uncharacterized protein DUF669